MKNATNGNESVDTINPCISTMETLCRMKLSHYIFATCVMKQKKFVKEVTF